LFQDGMTMLPPHFELPYFGSLSDGMNGFVYISDKTRQSSDIYSPIDGIETIIDNQTMYAFTMPLNFFSRRMLLVLLD
jgi:hypothetical protein